MKISFSIFTNNPCEIFYRNYDGTNWSTPVRLSAGNEQNRYPSIAERGGKLYVVWQRKTGTNTYDIHFRHFNGTSWETIRNVTTGISGDLPVIATSTPSASFEMMAAYRTGSGLKSQRSTSANGSSWQSEIRITSNTSALQQEKLELPALARVGSAYVLPLQN